MPTFPRMDLEESYVREQVALRRYIELSERDSHRLIPVSQVSIPINGRLLIIIKATAPLLQRAVKLKKQDSKLFVKLVKFSQDQPQGKATVPVNEPLSDSATVGESNVGSVTSSDTSGAAAPREEANVPVREVPIQAKVCRSQMELGHRHVNFGNMGKGERREKTIVVKNLSEVSLIYAITKTRSVASGT